MIWPSRLDPKGVSACLMLLCGSGVSAASNRNQIDQPPFSCSVISSMALSCAECEPNVILSETVDIGSATVGGDVSCQCGSFMLECKLWRKVRRNS